MKKYKYRAINNKSRPVSGVVMAASEADLYVQLQTVHLELVNCMEVQQGGVAIPLLGKRVKTRDLIQLFVHLEQMQRASVPLLDALADIRDTTENPALRDIMSQVHRDVNEGTSLSEALDVHPKVFPNIFISLIASGEETGDLVRSYSELVKYLKWRDSINRKVKKAVMMPAVTGTVVFFAVIVLMGFVVPQILEFVENMQKMMDMEIGFMTTSLVATSDFMRTYWYIVMGVPLAATFLFLLARRMSEEFRYRTDLMILNIPMVGNLIRKISIARFSQTFAALFASGVEILKSLRSAQDTVNNLAIREALDNAIQYVQTGSPLSEALNGSGEFPSMVVRMIRIGEESGNLTEVLDHVGEFYTNDVNEAVDAMVDMIQPTLTVFLGIIIFWIIAGAYGPIYGNLDKFQM
jgi:type IV pilus assembly protein PilC